jgi:prepilin-type N-terminal cleavage/methylation domain-containing protein
MLANRTPSNRRGYTLVELLTVIAISAILLTLIILPVIQSFALTRQAQALSNAQELGKQLTEKISREVSNAVAVRGAAPVQTLVNGANIRLPSTSLIVRVPRVNPDGTRLEPRQEIELVMPYSRMDLVTPAEIGRRGPNGGFIDPAIGKEDPTLQNFKGQTALPIAPGATITRYFIGLRDPFSLYNNPYDALLMSRNASRDNLYVLYRAEVQPRIFRNVAGQNVYAANTDFFEEDANNQPVLDDPRFFVPNFDSSGNAITSDAKAIRIRNWLRRSVIQTEVSRYDMLQTIYDLRSRAVDNRGGSPNVLPLVQFRPTRVASEPAEGQIAVRLGQEVDNAQVIAPDVFTTKLGLWSNATVRTWPVGWQPGVANANEYLVGRTDARNGQPGAPAGFSIYAFDPDGAISDDYLGGTELFDLATYDSVLNGDGRYPFTQAVRAADQRSGWLSDPNLRAIFTSYAFDGLRGRITASFGIDEVGDSTITPPVDNPRNLPSVLTGDATTPRTAGALGVNFYDPAYATVNQKFNKLWDTWERDTGNAAGVRDLDQSRIQRFIDLRVVNQPDGTLSPLNPNLGFKVAIVPGSEVVIGPDQNPGPNYGLPVRYVRVNTNPGPNQYRFNYTNLPEPGVSAVDYSLLGLTGPALTGFDPNVYDAQNFTSAIIQPQFKVGYVQLNSDPNTPIPTGPIRISYRFQFTGAQPKGAAGAESDILAVDYDSRELMSILLTIRNYPQSNQPNAQNVTLKATAKVRNYIR